jgi:hypothetical protein
VRARSIKGPSIFFGHCQSKSARGMKRPRRARSRGRARISLQALSDGGALPARRGLSLGARPAFVRQDGVLLMRGRAASLKQDG